MSYFEILNALSDGVLCIKKDNTVSYCNRRAADLIGLSVQEILSHDVVSVMDVSSVDDGSMMLHAIEHVRSTEEPMSIDNAYYINHHGGLIFVTLNIGLLKENDEQSLVITFQDITHYAKSEKAYLRLREQLYYILDALPVGIVIINEDRIIENYNTYIGELFGLHHENQMMGHLISCVHSLNETCGIDEACEDCPLTTAHLNDLKTRRHTFEIVSNSQVQHIDYSMTVVPIQDGDQSKYMVVLEDVSEANQVKAYVKELKSNVLKFHDHQELLIKEMKNQIIEPMKDMTLHNHRVTSKTVRHIMSLYHDLMDIHALSRLPKKTYFNPKAMLDHLEGSLKFFNKSFQIDASSIAIDMVKADEHMIKTLIGKVASSIMENTLKTEVHMKAYIIKSKLHLDLDEGSCCFDDLPFNYSVMTSIVEALEGEVKIDRHQMSLMLPVTLVHEEEWMSKKVLLIEDDVVQQKLVSKYLENLGYEVYIADDGKTGLTMFSEEMFVCVLLDLQMPIMNGFEVIKDLKSRQPEMPVIAVTSLSHDEQQEEIMGYGFDDFLAKPIDLKKLKHIMTAVTSKHSVLMAQDDIFNKLNALYDGMDKYSKSLFCETIDRICASSMNTTLNNLLYEAKLAYNKGYYNKAKELMKQASQLEV